MDGGPIQHLILLARMDLLAALMCECKPGRNVPGEPAVRVETLPSCRRAYVDERAEAIREAERVVGRHPDLPVADWFEQIITDGLPPEPGDDQA